MRSGEVVLVTRKLFSGSVNPKGTAHVFLMGFFKAWEETKKVPEQGRLAWYSGKATVEYWIEHWASVEIETALDAARCNQYPIGSCRIISVYRNALIYQN